MRWERLCRLDWQTLRALQEHRLQQFVRKQLYPFSPFYRELFDRHSIRPDSISGIDDLRRIPFTTKADLVTGEGGKGFRNFILEPTKEKIGAHWPLTKKLGLLFRKWTQGADAVKARLQTEYKPTMFTATTGRSSEQVLFFYSAYDLSQLRESGRRIMQAAAGSADIRVINMFPYAPHLAFWQTWWAATACRALGVSTGGGKVMNTRAHVKLIERLQPEFLVGVPSFVYHVLRAAVDEGVRFEKVTRVILGAEKVPPGMKDKMKALLGQLGTPADQVAILGTYGFTEAKRAWCEAAAPGGESTGYFTYPDMEIFEVINPETGDPVGEGEDGELVYTGTDTRGSVVLRYRTGDLVKGGMIWSQPCPHTGWTVPRIRTQISRVSNQKDLQLTKVKGTLVSLDSMAHVLMDSPEIEEWAIEIGKVNDDPYGLDELRLDVAVADGVTADDELKRKLGERLKDVTEISPNVIEFRSVRELVEKIGLEREMKEQRFFDRREGDAGAKTGDNSAADKAD